MRRKKRKKHIRTNIVSRNSNAEALKPWEAPFIEEKRRNLATKFADRSDVDFYDYELTDEPIFDKEYRKLPRKVQERAEDLYMLAQQQPAEALEEIRRFMTRYPKVSQFYNFLNVAYSALVILKIGMRQFCSVIRNFRTICLPV